MCLLNCIPGHLGALCAAALAARVEAEDLAAEDALRLAVAQPAPLHHLHALDQAPMYKVKCNTFQFAYCDIIFTGILQPSLQALPDSRTLHDETKAPGGREREMGLQIRLVTPVYAGFG